MDTIAGLTGLDFARGLIRVGFRLTAGAAGFLLLERADRAVTVPLCDRLDDRVLRFLLRAAGVTARAFGDAMARDTAPPEAQRRDSAVELKWFLTGSVGENDVKRSA
jgi:hypothetical protein